MAQNVTVAGASYSDVPSVELPKTGGGTALFADPSITTAIASDVASGKQFLLADGSIGTGTASGGGGASNIVTGTFKGTTTGAAMDVTLNYSGTGYPVLVAVYPTGGFRENETFASLVERQAFAIWTAIKHNMTNAPSYTSTNVNNQNTFYVSYYYKSSTSTADSYSTSSTGAVSVCADSAASNGATACLKLRSSTKMSVYIHGSSNYGFAANIEYTYYIIYSS